MMLLSGFDPTTGTVRVNPHLIAILRTYGVTDVLSQRAIKGFPAAGTQPTAGAFVYRIPGAARARFVANGRAMTDADAAKRLLDPAFDPDREVLLQDAPDMPTVPTAAPMATSGTAPAPMISTDGAADMTIDAYAPANGFVVISDTFYPGWTAQVDSTSVPIYRANLSARAIPGTPGRHVVRLHYDPPSWRTGLGISCASIAVLFAGLLAPFLPIGRRRDTSAPAPQQ